MKINNIVIHCLPNLCPKKKYSNNSNKLTETESFLNRPWKILSWKKKEEKGRT